MDDRDSDKNSDNQKKNKRKASEKKSSKNKKPPQWFLDWLETQKKDDDYSDDSDSDDGDYYVMNEEKPIKRRKRNREEEDSEAEDEDTIDYFDHDTQKLQDSIVASITNHLTKDQSEALRSKIKKGVAESFELLADIAEEKFCDLFDLQPTSNLWKLGMGTKEIKKYQAIIKNLRKDIEDQHVTIQKVLDAKLDIEGKRKLLQMFDILQKMQPHTIEYVNLERSINNIIEVAKTSPITEEKRIEIRKKEAALKRMVGAELPLKMRILNADMDDKRKAAIYEKYLLLEKNPEDSVTAACIEEWIEEALKTPFTRLKINMLTNSTPGECLLKLKKGFESKMSDMNVVLEPLLAIFNNLLHNPHGSNLVIGLLGSPGTGKTFCSRIIADVLNLPFHQISLGGIIDSSILDGQHSGWVGSGPGRFVRALQDMGVINGVIFLDEIDKLGETPAGLQVQYSLLHSIDPTQNSQFHDHYLGSKLPIDLSKCIIICALNKTEGLDPALLNRMSIVKVPDYTTAQKKNILQKHLFPNALKDTNLTTAEIQLTEAGCDVLLQQVTVQNGKEGGVRGVKAAIKIIVDKLALLLRVSPQEQAKLGLSFKIPELPASDTFGIFQRQLPIMITPDIVTALYTQKTSKTNYDHMFI